MPADGARRIMRRRRARFLPSISVPFSLEAAFPLEDRAAWIYHLFSPFPAMSDDIPENAKGPAVEAVRG
ncbi:MAG TPA: hypothetical protein VFX98_19400, partial [Longimicrobiaceae bacterium]|nr:hypothetical protein [Longimicrobiaceae bacterium]